MAFGGALGWLLRAFLLDRGLELRAQAAEIDRLRAALTDSEKRCAQQAAWMVALEDELTDLRPEGALDGAAPGRDVPLFDVATRKRAKG